MKLKELSVSQMQSVEIAKAVSANCKVLILDEPTSSLTQNEVEALFRIIEDLKAEDLLIKQDPISHQVSVHERCGTEMEINLKKQWFINTAEDYINYFLHKLLLENHFPKRYELYHV